VFFAAMAAMSNWKNVNNWHWVDKNCSKWAEAYFGRELVGTIAERDGDKVEITRVDEMTGDVDLNQRKGKIITLFDIQLRLKWKGTRKDGASIEGTVEIPEVMHDSDADDYVFDVRVNGSDKGCENLVTLVKRELTKELRIKLLKFSPDLIAAHSKDVYIDPEDLRTPSPQHPVRANTAPASFTTTQIKTDEVKAFSTTTIKDSIEFLCAAQDLYECLVYPHRVQVWARGSAEISPMVGSTFRLFDGNVTGKLLEADKPSRIVQEWRLSTWPAGK
jgi:activator of HSP90 ATPase